MPPSHAAWPKEVSVCTLQVTFVWKDERPTAEDAYALRSLCAPARELDLHQLLERLESDRQWDAGEYPVDHANAIKAKGNQFGLIVETRVVKDPK